MPTENVAHRLIRQQETQICQGCGAQKLYSVVS